MATLIDPQQLVLEDLPGLRVQRAERLVHQQDIRLERERARETDPLLHAARKLVGIVPFESLETHESDEPGDALPHLIGRKAGQLEAVSHVLAHALPRHQPEVLEHHGHVAART